MRISRLAKVILKGLPVLALLAATGVGLLIGKELYPEVPESRSGAPAPGLAVPQIVPEAAGDPCGLSNIYNSLPPKCRTPDGRFIPLPGTGPKLLVDPWSK